MVHSEDPALAQALARPDEELVEAIREIKRARGKSLLILGHHYQRSSIVGLSDFVGDSFGLSQSAARQTEARYIVFCGVHFMAESADILTEPEIKVMLPNMDAGCPMAEMAGPDEVETAWERIAQTAGSGGVIPITYMNSSAELKAFCGHHGGSVCTSSNAQAAFRWGLSRAGKILFFPDRYLGSNTARQLGMGPEKVLLWDRRRYDGGVSAEALSRAQVILWSGYCHVHAHFTLEMVERARREQPGCTVMVHPECREEVVDASDRAGSTTALARWVEEASPGTTLVIGTEINMVGRLAAEFPDRRVIPLDRSLCPNMFKISLAHLAWTLDRLGKVNIVRVPDDIREPARLALENMLAIT